MDNVVKAGDTHMHPIAEALRDLEEEKVKLLVDEELENGTPVMEVVGHLNEGMVAVGELFSAGDYFISQLIFSAEIIKGIMGRVQPMIQETGTASGGTAGRVVLGTVRGDIHDLSLIHISEPTRRTPISYAVFCLKKKKNKKLNTLITYYI